MATRFLLIGGILSTLLLATITAVFAQKSEDLFMSQSTQDDRWGIFGHKGNEQLNPACIMINKFDRTKENVELVFDLKDGELYLRVDFLGWKIPLPRDFYGLDPSKSIFVMLNMLVDNQPKIYILPFFLNTQSSVILRRLDLEVLSNLENTTNITVIPPGNNQPLSLDIKDGKEIVKILSECVKRSSSIPKSGKGGDSI